MRPLFSAAANNLAFGKGAAALVTDASGALSGELYFEESAQVGHFLRAARDCNCEVETCVVAAMPEDVKEIHSRLYKASDYSWPTAPSGTSVSLDQYPAVQPARASLSLQKLHIVPPHTRRGDLNAQPGERRGQSLRIA